MTKRALCALGGFLSLCLPAAFAQPDMLSGSSFGLPSLALSDGQPFSLSSAFIRMETATPDFLPALSAAEPQRAAAPETSGKDSSSKVLEVRRPYFDYAGGEVGVLYGKSSGKFGREFEQGYIIGSVGNDKFQITAGASYENSNGRVPRWGR
jgi:hypothetical protein